MILAFQEQTTVLNAYAVLINSTPGNASFTAHSQYAVTKGIPAYKAALESLFAGQSNATLASAMLANLGLTTAFTQAQAEAFLAANAGNRVGAMIDLAAQLYSYGGTDATLKAASTAYQAALDMSYNYSNNTNNVNGITLLGYAGQTLTLTAGRDNLTGSAFNDTFIARDINGGNTFQDGDSINGGAGSDTVYLDFAVVQNNNAITPSLTNVESVVVRAQSASSDLNGSNNDVTPANDGNNMPNARTIQIDAQRSLAVDAANKVTADLGVVNWESSNSRSDVVIEDVRIGNTQKTKDVTITFRESDPGNVDFGVYFDQHSLRNAGTGQTSLTINIMDTGAAGKAATAATPLLNNPYDLFKLGINGVLSSLQLDKTAVAAADTYEALLAVFNTALTGTGITAALSGTFTITDPLSSTSVTGKSLVLTAGAGVTISAPAGSGWFNTTGASVPADSNIFTTFTTGASSTTELVTSKVVLDDVGRGSTGGDLVIGGMSIGDTSTSRGVERFEITVEDSSKLQTVNGTNNALREVTIINGTTSNSSTAYNTVVANSGDLTVNGNVNANTDSNLPGVNNNTTWGAGLGSVATANHSGTNAAGFTDVRLIDGSAMTGKLNFTARVTVDSIGKYVTAVDTAASPTADVAGTGNVNFNTMGANFIYTGGSNADTMSVVVDQDVAASRSTIVSGKSDFTFSFNGGDGNDNITLDLAANRATATTNNPVLLGNAEAWYTNQVLNKNITINGGAGNDTIRKPGAGNATIDAGDGNDTLYTDNSGATSAGTYTSVRSAAGATAGQQESTARWVFNTADQSAAATPAARNLADLVSSSNSSYNVFNSKLTVTFRDLTASATVEHTGYKTTDLQINQAIKAAINNDAVLSKLLVATDGPANTLVVTSLTDGTRVVGDLGVALTSPAATAISTADVTAYNTANGTAHADANAVKTAMDAINVTLGSTGAAGNDYAARFANALDGVGLATRSDLNGVASQTTTDNTITPGAGNDVIVLSTTENVTPADTLATNVRSSNETIVYSGTFGDDVVVNFQATTGSNAGVTETHTVTWQAFGAAGTQSIGGMTITATGAFTNLQVAQVAGGGAAIAGLTITTAPTLWTAATAVGATTVFTSTSAASDVTDITGAASTGGGANPTSAVGVQGVSALLGGDILNLKAYLGTTATSLPAVQGIAAAIAGNPDSVIQRGTFDNTGTALTGVRNDSAAEVAKLYTDDATANKAVYITVAATNVGTVYSVVDGTGTSDLTVTLVGTIDLADTTWASLTLANFA